MITMNWPPILVPPPGVIPGMTVVIHDVIPVRSGIAGLSGSISGPSGCSFSPLPGSPVLFSGDTLDYEEYQNQVSILYLNIFVVLLILLVITLSYTIVIYCNGR